MNYDQRGKTQDFFFFFLILKLCMDLLKSSTSKGVVKPILIYGEKKS